MSDPNTRLNRLIVFPTAHSQDGSDDRLRELSETGRHNAVQLRTNFKSFEVQLVLTSPALRCRQTAEILFPGRETIVVEELYVAGDLRSAMLSLRDTLSCQKNGNLGDYIEGDTAGCLLRWGWAATIGIHQKIKSPKVMSVGIVGHAGFADIIAALLFPEHAEELSKMILSKGGSVAITPSGLLQYN